MKNNTILRGFSQYTQTKCTEITPIHYKFCVPFYTKFSVSFSETLTKVFSLICFPFKIENVTFPYISFKFKKDSLEIPFEYGLQERSGIDGWWFIPRNTTSLTSGVYGFYIEFH